jgi:hypothetical protein
MCRTWSASGCSSGCGSAEARPPAADAPDARSSGLTLFGRIMGMQ